MGWDPTMDPQPCTELSPASSVNQQHLTGSGVVQRVEHFLNISFLYSAAYVFDYVHICSPPTHYKAGTADSDSLTGTVLVRVPVQEKEFLLRDKTCKS